MCQERGHNVFKYKEAQREIIMSKFQTKYRNGSDGFISFCEENVCVSVTPPGELAPRWVLLGDLPDEKHLVTGRSYKDLWERHKEIARECLIMKNGVFIYTLMIFCWMRGDGKSFLTCLIFLWKWLNFPKQQLVLCANSKDQSTFVHYSEIRKIIENSPKLLRIVGSKNIQQKELRLRDGKGNIVSKIFSATTFTGILSNIGGYTFSEFFDLKNHKFFEEIDTSTRNITNAFGIIDTTVSAKTHPLFYLYQSFLKGEKGSGGIYFSYRSSPKGRQEDFWHPNMTQKQLDGFRVKHHIGKGFDRFFKNIWEAAEGKVFSSEEIEATSYLGVNKQLGCQKQIIEILKKKNNIIATEKRMQEKKFNKKTSGMAINSKIAINETIEGLWPIDSVYRLSDGKAQPRQCTVEELTALGDLYDTDWAIMIGMDRAGEGGLDKRTKARTIVTAIAKGLPQSRTRPEVGTLNAPDYIYILLNLNHVVSGKGHDIKAAINEIYDEYNGIDTYFSETWQANDLRDFCEEKDIYFDVKQPTLGLQKAMFLELYYAIEGGRFKSANVVVEGSASNNILFEEFGMFEHDPDKKSFGSPQKKSKIGVQDDVVFSIAMTIYGGRFLTVDDFEKRTGVDFFGNFYPDKQNVGFY